MLGPGKYRITLGQKMQVVVEVETNEKGGGIATHNNTIYTFKSPAGLQLILAKIKKPSGDGVHINIKKGGATCT